MRISMLALIGSAIALAGCGGSDDGSADATTPPPPPPAAAMTEAAPAAQRTTTAARPAAPTGTAITTGRSQFGSILFDTRKQAIYIFENDTKNKSNCYGQCAKDWPPVYTKGKPRARGGVKPSLLGTTKRRDGRLQVTYRGQPLYYYVDEGPGEVKCHNVFLNGGLWWVLGADGRRKA